MQQTALGELIYPIWLKNLGATIDRVADNQQETNKILEDICKAIKNADLESAFKHDILDATSIKRRLQRIKIIIGQKSAPNWNEDVVKEWEGCVRSNLNMTRRDLLRSVDSRQRDKTIFDVMDEIPEYRKIGVDLLVALERKYKIPPSLYAVEQVRQIGVLRREFDHSIIRCMNEQEFAYWVNDRCMEADIMFEGYKESIYNCFNYGRYKIYWIFAKKHPEFIPEQQLKYLSEQEMVNIINCAINDSNIYFKGNHTKYFPLSERKHDIKGFKDSFIDIVLRILIS